MRKQIGGVNYILIVLSVLFIQIILCDYAQAKSNDTEPAIEITNLPNQLGNYRHIQFESNGIELNAVILNKGYHAKLYHQNTTDQFNAQSIEQVGKNNNALIAINGGFYTSNYQPAGLYIENGTVLKKIAHDRLLLSCIQINDKGEILLENKAKNCLRSSNAMQTGPLLIEENNLSSNINLLQNKLTRSKAYFEPHRRTILAQSNDKKLLVIITSPITLQDAALLLKNSPDIFGVDKIQKALNLDGGASTGMYVKLQSREFYDSEIKPVKTLILIE